MNRLARLLAFSIAAALAIGCSPRNIIPPPKQGANTTVSPCDKLQNCGQCVSDARCGFCAASSRCLAIETAQACPTGWIPKDPEQTLCPADPAASQAKH